MRKHMKRCCPEKLPEKLAGPMSEERQAERRTAAGDESWISEEEVFEAAMRSVDAIEDPFLRRVLHLRFGLDRVEAAADGSHSLKDVESRRRTPAEVAETLGGKYKGKPEAALNHIRNALRSIPLVADDPTDLKVLYEDDELLAVAKPPFLRSTPVHRFVGKSLTNQLVGYTLQQAVAKSAAAAEGSRPSRAPRPEPPLLLHRLDQPTSGVVLCAKTKAAASIMQECWHGPLCRKEYLALATPGPDAQLRAAGDVTVVRAPIGADVASDDPVRRAVNFEEGQSAATRLEVLACSPANGAGSQFVLLSCVLEESGRTHQIRVHASHVGLPLVGDGMYGGLTSADPEAPVSAIVPGRVALHAWRLRVPHPTTKEELLIEAPLPADLASCLEACNIEWPPPP